MQHLTVELPTRPSDAEIPADAEIIVIGGGIVGCSIAYHLAKLGKRDVLLLEKSGLTHGSTWHAVGMIGQLRGHRNYTRMNSYSFELYSSIEAETGLASGWRPTGSLRLASSEARWREILRQATLAKVFGFPVDLLSAKDAERRCPIIDPAGVVGAAYMPTDGYVDPAGVTLAIAKGARMRGARLVEGLGVDDIATDGRRVIGVRTRFGLIRCETLVIAAGIWSNRLGAKAGIAIPSIGISHQYLVTEPVAALKGQMLPGFRDPDNLFYLDPQAGGQIAMGGFESRTEAFDPPENFGRELLAGDFGRIEELVPLATKRAPVLAEVGVRTLVNGPLQVSPDGLPVLGPASEYDNLFVATGFTAGIASGGGAGRVIAEWIVGGEQPIDLWPLDIRRFPPGVSARKPLAARAIEVHTRYYELKGSGFAYRTGRLGRSSPFHQRLTAEGAVMTDAFGFERPDHFAQTGAVAEHLLVRERVGLCDRSSLAKFEVSGPGALTALQRIFTGDLNRPANRLVSALGLTGQGGILMDTIVARLAPDRFLLTAGSGSRLHDFGIIRSRLPADGSVTLTDVTEEAAVLCLAGPRARDVLRAVTGEDVSNAAVPFMHWRPIKIGATSVRLMRCGLTGELGFELHSPKSEALAVLDRLMQAGAPHGIGFFGDRALDSLRLEKGYCVWGTDLGSHVLPLSAGLIHLVSKRKPDFVGRAAALTECPAALARVLTTFSIDGAAELSGGEAIFANGTLAGYASSAGDGPYVKKSILMGYVPQAFPADAKIEIEAEGKLFPATRHDKPLYDPDGLRLRG